MAQNNTVQIKHVIQTLSQEFALSQHPHSRKGGLIGLAACSIALGKDSGLYLKELIEPVLTIFNDADSRLRYYACEALYNIVKVAHGAVLPHFNVLFDGLSKAVRAWMLWGPLLPGSGSAIFPHGPWPQAAHVPLTHRMSRQRATVQPTELHPFVVGEDLLQQPVRPAVHHLLDPCASRFEELRARLPQPLRSTHLTSVSHHVWSPSGWMTQSRSGTGGGSSSPGWRVLSPFSSAHW
ncbi:uncharacterized protein LOC135322023 isoform X1 [Camelus dromedarius]|uniref:uncharacterized protein LOC135322023 isoform X1 n=1 Tax=Camelus dromedarius TaxID=9838 RepID=UPI003119CBD7